jgi:hypothetical protein
MQKQRANDSKTRKDNLAKRREVLTELETVIESHKKIKEK